MTRTGCIVDDAIIVLDRLASRYFLAPGGGGPPVLSSAARTDQSIILSWDDARPLCRATAREHPTIRATRAADPLAGPSNILMLSRLRWLEWRYAATLQQGLDDGLSNLENVVSDDASPTAAAMLIGSAFRAQRIWSSTDRCLPRSLALTHALRSVGSPAKLVLGVALHPFAAHAWVQDRDRVLNDTLDHVALFAPILVA